MYVNQYWLRCDFVMRYNKEYNSNFDKKLYLTQNQIDTRFLHLERLAHSFSYFSFQSFSSVSEYRTIHPYFKHIGRTRHVNTKLLSLSLG